MSRTPETRARDERFILSAITAGVLSKVPLFPLEQRPEHCILLACGDFVHARDKLSHLWERITENTHVIMLNGGGLLLDGLSRVNQGTENVRFVTGQILGAIRIKAKQGITITRVYDMVDYDCGVGEEHVLSVQETLRTAIAGKTFLKETLQDKLRRKIEVGLLFLVHDEVNDKNTTWYFSGKAMTDFMDSYKNELDLETSAA